MTRQFFRNVVKVEMLCGKPLDRPFTVMTLADEIAEGECAGRASIVSIEEITGKEMARLLKAQGHDPESFQLTEDGEDLPV